MPGFLRCSEYGNQDEKSLFLATWANWARPEKNSTTKPGAHAGDIGIDLVCGIGELSKELVPDF